MIVGFVPNRPETCQLFDYTSPTSEPHRLRVERINPYLVDAADIVLAKRRVPLQPDTPEVRYGSMPIDDGHLILSDQEKREALREEPGLQNWVRPYFGGDEFINGTPRWCLWLVDASPGLLRTSPLVRKRVERVREFRLRSGRAETVALAATPALFGERRQPTSRYLLVPKVSSESRSCLPIGFMSPESIASGSALIVPEATTFHLGVLTSTMHMAWMRGVCGRMKSDYQYSARIVYNNFPWPEAPSEQQEEAIAVAAQEVLDSRAKFHGSTLAELYDPLTMPPALVKAHQKLDKAVDVAYGYKGKPIDAERVAFLFDLYQKYTTLFEQAPLRSRRRRAAAT